MISIIVPNYNKSNYILKTLQSIENQNYKNWECIVIDDNSNDNSIELIKGFIESNSRFKFIINNKNYGASYSRNLGINCSKGEYIIFLDADDIISSDCFSNRIKKISANMVLDFAVFPMGTFYEKIGDCKNIWNKFKGNHLYRFLSHDLPWGICSVIWRKESLLKLGGFNEDFLRLQDVELHTRALINSYKYSTFPNYDSDCFYRINRNRIKDYTKHCLNVINGKIFFITFFNFKLKNKIKFNHLKGTYFECYCYVFNLYHINRISKSDLLILLSKIDSRNFQNIFNYFSQIIINLYSYLRINKIYFRGLDRVFKFLYMI